jgi:hypothetical protein
MLDPARLFKKYRIIYLGSIKPMVQLSSDQKRKIAFTAAQAWGADKMFEELFRELAGQASKTASTGP